MIRVVVSGARGRLGGRIVEHVRAAEGMEAVAGVVRSASRPDEGEALALTSNPSEALRQADVWVEAALVPAALRHAELAAEAGVPMCVATTGFDASQRSILDAIAQRIPILMAPNLSMGVTALLSLVEQAARALPNYHLEILEMHHARKRDAPSGTAWALARSAAEARGQDADRDAILARAGDTGPRGESEIGLQTLRGGEVIGEHTVYLVGPTERLELTHRAQTRDAFAAGAVAAVRFLADADRTRGLFTMREVLGLS